MHTNQHGSPFIAELKPSKKLHRLCLAIHLLALAAGFANALPFVVKLSLATLIVLNFKIQNNRLKSDQRTIKYTGSHGWEVSDGSKFEVVTVAQSTVITTLFIFLHMRDKPAILIANDALNEDDYRQLIVKLKITAHEPIQRH